MLVVLQSILFVLLILPRAYLGDNTPIIVSADDIDISTLGWIEDLIDKVKQKIFDIEKCIKHELSQFPEFNYTEEIKITDDIKVSNLFLKGINKWTFGNEDLDIKMNFLDPVIMANVTWPQIEFNTDYDMNLETIKGKGRTSLNTTNLKIDLKASMNVISKNLKIQDFNLRYKTLKFHMSNLYMGHINVGERLQDLFEEHPDELSDIIRYVLQYTIKNIVEKKEENKVSIPKPFISLSNDIQKCFK